VAGLEQQLEADIKTAMLAGEKTKVTTLRGLKAALLSAKVAGGKRETGLTDDEVLAILAKQSKQRQESADLFKQGGNQVKADEEITEKALIDAYLPAPLNEAEVAAIIKDVIAQTGAAGPQAMGQVIGAVKAKTGTAADGSLIARLVKEQLA
jgi:uncharacterized protein YqeY